MFCVLCLRIDHTVMAQQLIAYTSAIAKWGCSTSNQEMPYHTITLGDKITHPLGAEVRPGFLHNMS